MNWFGMFMNKIFSKKVVENQNDEWMFFSTKRPELTTTTTTSPTSPSVNQNFWWVKPWSSTSSKFCWANVIYSKPQKPPVSIEKLIKRNKQRFKKK